MVLPLASLHLLQPSQLCQEERVQGSSAILTHAVVTSEIARFRGRCQGLSSGLCLEAVLQP